jgi:opacity protein-like surface antigen
MKSIILTAVAISALSGVAQAAPLSDSQFLQTARCRGLAASEGLGKLDTAAIDAVLRAEGGARELPVRTSANRKIAEGQAQGDKAEGGKKEKLLAERQAQCAGWLAGGQ